MNIITRNEYLNIIKTVIDLPLNSVEEYLDSLTKKYSGDNSFFEENLYKDILQVMDGIDNEGDNDLLIENGDFVIKNGDIQLTGKQNGLHIAMSWLYLRILQKTRSNNTNPSQSINKLHQFNEEFLKEDNNTPEVTA